LAFEATPKVPFWPDKASPDRCSDMRVKSDKPLARWKKVLLKEVRGR
jgi:hypothetical protein